MDQETVECETHGTARAAYVCRHLATGRGLGFFWGEDPDDPDGLFPDAWCAECEEVLDAHGEWNDEAMAFADITLVCGECYVDIRANNWLEDRRAFGELCDNCLDDLDRKQAALRERFDLDRWERYDWSLDTGELVFSHHGEHDGEARVVTRIAMVGSQSAGGGTWMWGWANRSLPSATREQLAPVRSFGERDNHLKLRTGYWRADEEDGWRMTAIACRELGGIGGYRTPTETGHVYMVILDARRVAAAGRAPT